MSAVRPPSLVRKALVGTFAVLAMAPATASAQQYFTLTTNDLLGSFPGPPATVPIGFDPSAYFAGGRILDVLTNTPAAPLHPLLGDLQSSAGGALSFVQNVDGVGVATSSSSPVAGFGDAPAAVLDLGALGGPGFGLLGFANTPVLANAVTGGAFGAATANASITFTPPAGTTFFGFLFAELDDSASDALGVARSTPNISFTFGGGAPTAYGPSLATSGGALGSVPIGLLDAIFGPLPLGIGQLPVNVGLFGLVLDPQNTATSIASVTFTTTGAGAIFPVLAVSNGAPISSVPEPMTIALVGSGLLVVGGVARRRRAQG